MNIAAATYEESQGVRYVRAADDPQTFYYWPDKPQPERDAKGRPTLLLLASEQGAFLQSGTRWDVTPDELAQLRAALAARYQLPSASIRLQPAQRKVENATLEGADENGRFSALQQVTTSGFVPFTALFNVTLTAAQKANAIAALNGRGGLFRVTYHAEVAWPITAEAVIAGEAEPELTQLGANPTLADCRKQIAEALTAGRLQWQNRNPSSAVAALQQQAEQQAQEQAAEALWRMAQSTQDAKPKRSSRLCIKVNLTDQDRVAVTTETDLSDWFPANTGPEHVRMVGVSIPAPAPAAAKPARVKLGFDPQGAPLAMIQLRCGATHLVLRSPFLDAVQIPAADAAQPLRLQTSYLTGGATYETTLAPQPNAEWALTAADVGLARLTLDATARRQAGAKAAQIRVQYQPRGAGTAEEQEFRFRYGDWQASWFVITRHPALDGTFVVTWKETLADDQTVSHPPLTTEQTALRL